MYERNAIVLERYFSKLFFNNQNNLRENYYNYRDLFECYGTLCDAKEREKKCSDEFKAISDEILKLQQTQEKLYNKSAKFEYSRSVIFENIGEDVDKIEKHLDKVTEDVEKNDSELRDLGAKFVEAVTDYNNKNSALKEAIAQREKAQVDYDRAYSKAGDCYENIPEEDLNLAKDFISSDNKDLKKDLQETFDNNGKKEKNPFDPDVISNTINKSLEIYKAEIDVYLAGFDRITKLFEELETDSVKVDKHTKYYRDSEAKVKFLASEKEYIVQFLDNERIGAIYDKKAHRKLMLEACKKFVLDFEQIDRLYDIILKEVAGRSTKKIYKENYNKEYLINLENSSVEPSLDTGKMRQEAIAFMNLNYWRASGLRSVYDAFDDIVTSIYGIDLTEFDPEAEETADVQEISEAESLSENENVEELELDDEIDKEDILSKEAEKPKKAHDKVYYSSKKDLAKAIFNSLQSNEFSGQKVPEKAGTKAQAILESVEEEEEKYSIPEKAQAILESVEEEEDKYAIPEKARAILEKVEKEKAKEVEESEEEASGEIFDLSKLDDIEYEEDDISSEEVEKLDDEEITEEDINDEELEEFDDDEEDSILDIYFSENNENGKSENVIKQKAKDLEKKVGIFHKLTGLNAKKRNEA